jgi:hypothetical protein
MQKIIYLLLASMLILSSTAYADSKKIVKWVDSKGVTHYGDKLPAAEAGRSSTEMNNRGIVVKRNDTVTQRNDVFEQEKLEKERKDKILLASYTNAEEIDLARDRSVEMDKAALTSLTSRKESVVARIARNNKTAEGFRNRKKPVPPYLLDELKLSKQESANIDKQLTQRKLSMEATKARYAEEKARFIALKQPTISTPVSAPEPASSNDAAKTNVEKSKELTQLQEQINKQK